MDRKRMGPRVTGPMPVVCAHTRGRSGANNYRLRAASVKPTISPLDLCSAELPGRTVERAAGDTTMTAARSLPAVALEMRASS